MISVRAKEGSGLMKVLAILVKPFNPQFMTGYITTIGRTIYAPHALIGTPQLDDILRHEEVHVAQYEKWGFLYYLSYLFPPCILTFRAYWELQAYYVTLQAIFDRQGYIHSNDIEWIVSQFTSSSYLFMFPFPKTIRKYLNTKKDEISKESRSQS